MPQLRQGDQALTVMPDAGSSAIVRTYPRLVGGESTSQVALGAGQSQRFLATPTSSRFAIEVTAGTVQYATSLFEDAGWDGSTFPALVSGDGDITVNNRDSQGRVTSYAQSGVTYTVTYTTAGNVNTVAGNGKITTYSYDASGLLTGSATV
jgi:hypothetical protein